MQLRYHGLARRYQLVKFYTVVGVLLLVAVMVVQQRIPDAILSGAPGLASSFSPVEGRAAQAPAAQAKAPTRRSGGSSSQTEMPVVGEPSVSAQLIDRVLARYKSPATGQGQVIYDLGIKYGIDPAFLLAFFIHESSAGTNRNWAGLKPDGTTTHNVGNIVCGDGWACHGRFRDYASWEQGIEDWYRLIQTRYIGDWKRSTVEAIIPKYAPASDNNDEERYIRQVREMVADWRNE